MRHFKISVQCGHCGTMEEAETITRDLSGFETKAQVSQELFGNDMGLPSGWTVLYSCSAPGKENMHGRQPKRHKIALMLCPECENEIMAKFFFMRKNTFQNMDSVWIDTSESHERRAEIRQARAVVEAAAPGSGFPK